jgi:hypothetical protein
MVGGTGAVMLALGAVSMLAALAYAAGLAMRGPQSGASKR